ncbi:MAG TPA: hypothetical protein VGL83_00655 [Stellaceae bacterium]|jgi:hypothetical protein
MKKHMRFAVLLSALALQGCTFFTISDNYGNSYGGFFDYGNKYLYQLATCEAAPGLVEAAAAQRPRWMQCCMWRNGVPIDDSTGCAAPPFYNG